MGGGQAPMLVVGMGGYDLGKPIVGPCLRLRSIKTELDAEGGALF